MTDPDARRDDADTELPSAEAGTDAADSPADTRTPPRTAGQRRTGRRGQPELWTIDDVRQFLGHEQLQSARVWLSRHGVEGERMYDADEVRRVRGSLRPSGRGPSRSTPSDDAD